MWEKKTQSLNVKSRGYSNHCVLNVKMASMLLFSICNCQLDDLRNHPGVSHERPHMASNNSAVSTLLLIISTSLANCTDTGDVHGFPRTNPFIKLPIHEYFKHGRHPEFTAAERQVSAECYVTCLPHM